MHCVYSVKYTLYCHMCTLCFPCQFRSSWKFLSEPFYVGDQHKIGVKFLAWVHILCQLSRFWFRNSHHLPGIQCDRLCLENHSNFDPTNSSNVALFSKDRVHYQAGFHLFVDMKSFLFNTAPIEQNESLGQWGSWGVFDLDSDTQGKKLLI